MSRYKVGIIGASGYTGHELVKLLLNHPDVELGVLNSRSFAGRSVSSLYPDFEGDEKYTGYDYEKINGLGFDLIFLALPSGMAAAAAAGLDTNKVRIIDLSADFRFEDPLEYEKAYKRKADFENNKWVFGLPELFKEKIKQARFVANPGCYVTASILASYPVQKYAERIIFDCKSGWSGAGRDSVYAKDPSIIDNNLIAYNISRHRHKYEIQQFIKTKVSFTPHVVNTFQGLMCTAHIILNKKMDSDEVKDIYTSFYQDVPFVRIREGIPALGDTRRTNFCDIGGFEIDESEQLVVISSIDNLWKGASGQAVQNMNLMLGLEEKRGLA